MLTLFKISAGLYFVFKNLSFILPKRCLDIESVRAAQFIRARRLGYNFVQPQKENIVLY